MRYKLINAAKVPLALLLLLFASCQKDKIQCETDAECEEMLVGVWEDSPGFITLVYKEFTKDMEYYEYSGKEDYINGNNTGPDSILYRVNGDIIEYYHANTLKIHDKEKIISLTEKKLVFQRININNEQLDDENKSYKRIN